jgi:hypothetical protein
MDADPDGERFSSVGMLLLCGELAGSAGLGFVWGWLLVQLTAAARPAAQRWIVPLVATVALLGAMLVLLDVRAMVTGAVAAGTSAVLHAALIARLRLRSGNHESFQFSGGGPR